MGPLRLPACSIFVISLLLAFILALSTATANAATSITQHGITWVFDGDYTTGQFINGDYWVLDPGTGVKITGISPGAAVRSPDGTAMNGSMLNPGGIGGQGYDGAGGYEAGLNVGLGISAETPLALSGNQSLVSTISNDPCGDLGGGNHVPYVKSAAVLTSVSSIPATDSFRPGVSGSTKIFYRESKISTSKLKSLSSTVAKPNISTLADKFILPWIAHYYGYRARYLRPSDSGLDDYYYTEDFSTAALLLNSDYTLAQKETLIRRYIQIGIDVYSFVADGGYWASPDGGHFNSTKFLVLFAGTMLDDAGMLGVGSSMTRGRGNETDQTFYVTQQMVGFTPEAGNYTYEQSHVGMPDWMDKDTKKDSSWGASYRGVGSGAPAWVGEAVAAVVMGLQTAWNHPPFFDYMERYMGINKSGVDPFGYTVIGQSTPLSRGDAYSQDMYDTYWHVYNPRHRRLFRNVRLHTEE